MLIKIKKVLKSEYEKVYCISLEESKKRQDHIKKELNNYNIKNYEIVDVVDKDDLIVDKAYECGLVKLYGLDIGHEKNG